MGIDVVNGLIQNQLVDAIVLSCGHTANSKLESLAAEIFSLAGHTPCGALASQQQSMCLGAALLLSPGRTHFKGIIHVSDYDEGGRSTDSILETVIRNVVAIVEKENYWSFAVPVLGVSPDGLSEPYALATILLTIRELNFMGDVVVVRQKITV
jgi:hypothetical protein